MDSMCEEISHTELIYVEYDATPPRKIAKTNNKHRRQKFRDAWLQHEDYKQWLSKVPEDQYKAKCRTCNVIINAELTVIKNHMASKVHKKRYKPLEAQTTHTICDDICTKTKAAQVLEVKLCGFVAEHNISFTTLAHLTTLLKCAVPDSDIIRKIQLKSTKGTAIIKNVIAVAEKEELQKKLQTSLFSVLIDESTDIGSIQTMCIIVRFFDAEVGQVVSKFWDLCQVFDPSSDVEGATAEHLFKLVTKSFEGYEIPFKNIIGFASDGASTMMGTNNSVASRFIAKCPGIYIFKCICHSLHLCASNACKKLPRSCEDLARNIYGEFKNNTKQQHLFQTFLEIDINKILRPAQTHWISLKVVVSKIIEHWPALELYFREQMLSIRYESVEQIVEALSNPLIKLLYLFLDFILPKFTKLNELFQSSSVAVTSLYDKMCQNYKELLGTYMSRDYIDQTDLSELDPRNETYRLHPENMYFGVEVKKMLNQMENLNIEQFKSDFAMTCVEFLIESCSEIKQRFNFSNPVLKLITNLNPEKAMLKKTRVTLPSLLPLMEALPRITSNNHHQIIDDEWRQLPYFELPGNIDIKDPIDIFWANLMDCGEGDQGMTFKNVSKFVLNVISLPHSNAESERIFSHINLIQTKTRNKMVVSTVNSLLLAKQRIKHNNSDCTTYEPSQSEYGRMDKSLIYKNKKTSESTDKENSNLYCDTDEVEFDSILMPYEEF